MSKFILELTELETFALYTALNTLQLKTDRQVKIFNILAQELINRGYNEMGFDIRIIREEYKDEQKT